MFARLFTLLLLSVVMFSSVFAWNGSNVFASKSTSSLSGAKSYKVYYDFPSKKIIKNMARYDVVIVEPQYYTKELVKTIQAKGTKLYGYVSVMESDNWNKYRMSAIAESDYYLRDGKKVHFEMWDSYLMDLTSEHYQEVLFNEIKEQVVDKGFTGVFFDTVGDIDDQFYYTDLKTHDVQAKAFVSLLDRTVSEFEQLSLIQNWGFELFKGYTHSYMDGIMWENFEYSTVAKDEWALNQINSLKALQKDNDFQVLTLSFNQKWQSTKFSRDNVFVHYHENNHFNKW